MTPEDKALATVTHLNPLSPQRALSSSDEWTRVEARFAKLQRAGGLPAHVKNPAQAIAITRFGLNYGWDETRSLQNIYIVKGNPTLKTEAMGALVAEKLPRSQVEILEHTMDVCRIRGRRSPDDPWNTADFTFAEAKAANLDRNPTWKAYRKDMLFWRAASRLYRRHFADATAGAYTYEEMQDGIVSQRGQKSPQHSLPPEALDQRPAIKPEDVIDIEPSEPGTIGESLQLNPPGRCDLCHEPDGYHLDACPHVKRSRPDEPYREEDEADDPGAQ